MVRRYGIYWVALDPARGRETRKSRPAVVVSPNAMHKTDMAVVCPLTSVVHPDWKHRLQIRCAGKDAEIMPDQIRAISVERIGKRLDTLSAADAEALRQLIVMLYGMP